MYNEHFLVVGLGISGFSVVEYLAEKNIKVSVTDSSTAPSKLAELNSRFPQVNVLLGEITIPPDVTKIIISPGVPTNLLQTELPIIGDVELFAQVVDKPVIVVTGSNGKSTVTTLLGLMAKASNVRAGVGGNLGTPALSLLDPNNQCYILELSSFQLETLHSLRPQAAIILNISPDHMDRYTDFADYKNAKLRIYNNAKNIVFNRQDELTTPVNTNITQRVISFGLDVPQVGDYGVINHHGNRWLARGREPLMAVADLAMLGEHNVANALAALAMGELAGFAIEAMLQVLSEFAGLEHRCEKVLHHNDVLWINDSKGTNVAATVNSLLGVAESIPGKWVMILGGLGKNADFAPLVEPLQKYCRAAILLGASQSQLWDLLHDKIPCHKVANLEQAVEVANSCALAGDGVLLSPACASWDMFLNYMQRGQMFKQQVLQRIGKQDATTTTAA